MSQPGLELLYESVAQQLKCSEDAVMCVLHWNIVSSGYKCTGVGESGASKKTELLPRGWNDDSNLYVLRYQNTTSQEDFVLKVVKIDSSLLVHFMRTRDEKVTSVNVRVANFTTDNITEFDSAVALPRGTGTEKITDRASWFYVHQGRQVSPIFAFKNLSELEKRIKSDLLKEFEKGSKEECTASSSRTTQGRQPLYEEDPLRVPSRRQPPPPDWMPARDPFAVGRGDLDPLAGGMGGMLMDPRRSGGQGFGPDPNAGLPGRLPPGAVPPGARFDPFGPPGRPGPDPDHLPPPGYDDMFM